MTKKPTPEEIATDPARYKVYESGAVFDRDLGQIVTKFPGKYDITAETSQQMHARRRELTILGQMRGLAAATGIELPPDADLEDVIQGSTSAGEALTKHMAKTFLESKNLRGMGETYTRLMAPLLGESQGSEPGAQDALETLSRNLAGALIELARRKGMLKGEILEGEVSPETVQAQAIAKIK